MPRSFPVFALLMIGTLITSVLAGFLLASWAIGGITPGYAAPPALAQSDTRDDAVTDGWREAGYARIGLWEQPVPDHAAGSSRL